MKLCLGLILFFLLISCTTTIKPVCRHWAWFSAITASDIEGYPVRIGLGYTGIDLNLGHAQAEAFIDGVWVPINYFYGKIRIVEKDRYYGVKYYTVQEFAYKVFGSKHSKVSE